MEKIQFIPADLSPNFVMGALSQTQDWGQISTNIKALQSAGNSGAGILVAVLDTGQPQHIDLNENTLPGMNCTDDSTVFDLVSGHSTHVSGIIAACENEIGVVGVAPNAKVLPIKVLSNSGCGSYDDIARGIRAAYLAGADIINLSLGTAQEPIESDIHHAIKEAVARGVFVVAAAGNDAQAVNFPARYPEVIAVAALDNQGNLADFSSRGEQVAFAAPGVDIYSTYLKNGYARLSGSSQAAPFIAGVVALIIAKNRAAGVEIPVGIDGVKFILSEIDQLTDKNNSFGSDCGFAVPRFANVSY